MKKKSKRRKKRVSTKKCGCCGSKRIDRLPCHGLGFQCRDCGAALFL